MKKSLNTKPRIIFSKHRGVLGLDEGVDRLKDRFIAARFDYSSKTQRSYLDLMITTPKLNQYVSAITLTDQAARLLTKDAIHFAELVKQYKFFLGIRADLGYERSTLFKRQVLTRGIIGLEERIKSYVAWDTDYVVWRNKYYIESNLPTLDAIQSNNQDVVEFVLLAHKYNITPVIQIKISTNAKQTLEASEKVMSIIFEDLFTRLEITGVDYSNIVLQTNFITPGRYHQEQATPKQVAKSTWKIIEEYIPKNLGGLVFVSDGVKHGFARLYLEEFHTISEANMCHIPISFAFGRGLHDSAIQIWGNKDSAIQEAQINLLQNSRLDFQANH